MGVYICMYILSLYIPITETIDYIQLDNPLEHKISRSILASGI